MSTPHTYPSKIGLGLSLFIAIALIGASIPMLLEQPVFWMGIAINATVALFITYTFTNLRYSIEQETLLIRCGFLYKKSIPIHAIKRIEESRSPLSSPAASMDRLEIIYNKFDSILISPKEKQAFIEELVKKNPEIVVLYRKK